MTFHADLGPRPSKRHTLDRLDVNGNYEPGNVRWATAAEQMQNQRRIKLSPDKVLEIRATATPHNKKYLAEKYGVSLRMIYAVSTQKAWKNIEAPCGE